MEKLRSMNLYQKILLILLAAMVLIFAVIYFTTVARSGFEYRGAILVPRQEDGCTVYSGRLNRQSARFTVTADKAVVFECGGRSFGPYTMKEDPTAIQNGKSPIFPVMKGVEVYCGDELLFRGGFYESQDGYLLFDEAGDISNLELYFSVGDEQMDMNGKRVDPIEPTAADILALMYTPKLTHKGNLSSWFFGMFICALNALSIVFADKFFRHRLSFYIRNADEADPADWAIGERYFRWALMTVLALTVFIMGLKY